MSKWASTWDRSALQAAGIEVTAFAKKAMALWNKSTPTEPWSHNPIGIPAGKYGKRKIPGTKYALYLTDADFNAAFSVAIRSERDGAILALLSSGDSVAKLWREINSLDWPAAATENDWPREIREWVGDDYSSKLNMPAKTPHRSTGSTGMSTTSHQAVINSTKAMITAAQTKRDLASAIKFIIAGSK